MCRLKSAVAVVHFHETGDPTDIVLFITVTGIHMPTVSYHCHSLDHRLITMHPSALSSAFGSKQTSEMRQEWH
jgi:hypothetical protein